MHYILHTSAATSDETSSRCDVAKSEIGTKLIQCTRCGNSLHHKKSFRNVAAAGNVAEFCGRSNQFKSYEQI